jgi:hypothetical protein
VGDRVSPRAVGEGEGTLLGAGLGSHGFVTPKATPTAMPERSRPIKQPSPAKAVGDDRKASSGASPSFLDLDFTAEERFVVAGGSGWVLVE